MKHGIKSLTNSDPDSFLNFLPTFLMASSDKPLHTTINPSHLNSTTHFITIKFTIENFLLWKAQIVPFLKGHQPFGYVDGSLPMPSATLDNLPNLAYTQLLLQDQLIISAINSSLSVSILAQVLDYSTSCEV